MLKDWCPGFLKLSKNHTFNHYLAKPVEKGNEMKMKIFFTRAKGFSPETFFFLSKVIVIVRDQIEMLNSKQMRKNSMLVKKID